MATIKSLVFVFKHTSQKSILKHFLVFRPALQIITQDAHNLSNNVTFTAALADNISKKVRELDVTKVGPLPFTFVVMIVLRTPQRHVVACLRRANDIIDLKKCTDGVKRALEDEEYEQVRLRSNLSSRSPVSSV